MYSETYSFNFDCTRSDVDYHRSFSDLFESYLYNSVVQVERRDFLVDILVQHDFENINYIFGMVLDYDSQTSLLFVVASLQLVLSETSLHPSPLVHISSSCPIP